VHTTSQPRRRTKSSGRTDPSVNPLKSIRLTITLHGPRSVQLERFAEEKGFSVEERGGRQILVIRAATAEEALAQLALLTGLVAPKG